MSLNRGMDIENVVHLYNGIEKIFTNPISNRGLISNMYKELKKLDSRKTSNPIKKSCTALNNEFSTEKIKNG
jgi:hypothetical protein